MNEVSSIFLTFFHCCEKGTGTLPPEECSCITVAIFLFNCTGTPVAVSMFIKHGGN